MNKAALFFLLFITGARAQTAPIYVLHEWGTFTTVSGSDGALLPGLQREEEGLPSFVQSHEGMENLGNVAGNADGTISIKGWIRPLKNVTVKMETPVIYLYTKEPFQLQLSVDFHGGSISQWYPSRSGGETPPENGALSAAAGAFGVAGAGIYPTGKGIDFAKNYEGSIRWDVAVTPPAEGDAAQIFHGDETTNWLYPRQTDSSLLRAPDGTAEKYLFYRGVGRFDLPLVLRMKSDDMLDLQNDGTAHIPKIFVYEMGEGGAVRFHWIDGLAVGKSTHLDLSTLPWTSQWRRPVYDTLAKALREAGLYRKEADAMLQTWWGSYFQRPGLRVFWIVPTSFTEKILPLTAQPVPGEKVRVLVGRSEILTPKFEKALLEEKQNPEKYLMKNTRFIEAYNERVRQLSKE